LFTEDFKKLLQKEKNKDSLKNNSNPESEGFDISPRVYAYLHGNIYKQLEIYISTWKEN